MNYYALRRMVAVKIHEFVVSLHESPDRDFLSFKRSLILETGCSDRTIETFLDSYGLIVEGNRVVKHHE